MQRLLGVMVTSLAAVLLSACATTDELYAEYDDQACVVAVPVGLNMGHATATTGVPWNIAVYFALDKQRLTDRARRRLDENLAVLREHKQLRVLIRGFTDNIAPDDYNLKLAERRVASVVGFYEGEGLHTSRITLQPAFGEGYPVNANLSEDSRAANRRVEMLLMDAEGRILSFSYDADQEQIERTIPPGAGPHPNAPVPQPREPSIP